MNVLTAAIIVVMLFVILLYINNAIGGFRVVPSNIDRLKWIIPPMLTKHNCYDYAFDNYDLLQRSTSQVGGHANFSCSSLAASLENNHPGLIRSSAWAKCPAGTHKIALAASQGNDYHFYREEEPGLWSHKPGETPPTLLDSAGDVIKDPRFAEAISRSDANNLNPRGSTPDGKIIYRDFCGFFCAPSDSDKIM